MKEKNNFNAKVMLFFEEAKKHRLFQPMLLFNPFNENYQKLCANLQLVFGSASIYLKKK